MLSIGNPEHILREQELSFRTMYSHEGLGHVRNEEREPIYLLDHSFQSLDCKGLTPSPTSRAQSVPAAVNPNIESDPPIREYI